MELLLSEFGKCGGIAQHGTFGAPASANWLYLQFQVAHPSAAYCVVWYTWQDRVDAKHGTPVEHGEVYIGAPSCGDAAAGMLCELRGQVPTCHHVTMSPTCHHKRTFVQPRTSGLRSGRCTGMASSSAGRS